MISLSSSTRRASTRCGKRDSTCLPAGDADPLSCQRASAWPPSTTPGRTSLRRVSPRACRPARRAAAFPGAGARLLRLSELAADLERRSVTTPAIRLHPDNICYAIYTSGSTGDPRAVAVSYGSLASVIGSVADEYQIGDDDRVAQ